MKYETIFFAVAFASTVVLAIALEWGRKNTYEAVAAMVANGADPVRARAAIDGKYDDLIECKNGAK